MVPYNKIMHTIFYENSYCLQDWKLIYLRDIKGYYLGYSRWLLDYTE